MLKLLDIKKCVAIQNYGISGTTLLHSLLDNTPEIISLPLIASLPLYQFLVDNPKISIDEYLSYVSKSSLLFDIQDGSEFRLDELGENSDKKLNCDFFQFSSCFNALMEDQELSVKNILIATFQAYNLCFDCTFKDDSWMCLAIHSLPKKYIEFLLIQFDEVKIIHMVREPVQNAGALVKHIDAISSGRLIFISPLRSVVTQIISNDEKMSHWGLPSTALNGKRVFLKDNDVVQSRAVRLEDLHSNGMETLHKISDWIRVDWHENFLKSTVMGLLWHNRRESIKQSGLKKDGVIAQQYTPYLSKFDRKRINSLMIDEKKHFNYENDNRFSFLLMVILVWIPFKMEFKQEKIRKQTGLIREDYQKSMRYSLEQIVKSFGRQDASGLKFVKTVVSVLFFLTNYSVRKVFWYAFKFNEFIYIRYLMLKKMFGSKVELVKSL